MPVVCAALVLTLFYVANSQNTRASCKQRGAKKGPPDSDKTRILLNTTKPVEPFAAASKTRSSQYDKILKQYKCSCSKTPPPTSDWSTVDNVCPSQSYSLTIGTAVDGCWVAHEFKHHVCTYTTCKNFGRCQGVKPWWGSLYCVQDAYKTIGFYVWCWQNGHWKFKVKYIALPTCCSCKRYC